MTPEVRTTEPSGPAVVMVVHGDVGLHVGIALTVDGEAAVFVHLAWHLALRVEAIPDPQWWVVPRMTRAALAAVAQLGALVAERPGRLPYALEHQGARFTADGALDLGGRHGLTCASFVAVLFESVNAPLIELSTWHERDPARKAEDDTAQQRLVDALAVRHPTQAALVQREVGCPRIRPEEIAAASGIAPQPVAFDRAEAGGRVVAEVVAG